MGELSKGASFVEKKVALYLCHKCGTRFPVVAGSTRFKIISDVELKELKKKASEHKKLKEEVEKLEGRIEGMKRELVLERLRGKKDGLKSEVAMLKQIKAGLEEELSLLERERGDFLPKGKK